ncbi:MAG: hypothetical protein CMA68_02965 [Euryarchaeota archaeon]|nr:hypothetical protein [Euryarchaeota archaeon]
MEISRRGQSRSRTSRRRKSDAAETISELSETLSSNISRDIEIANVAARDILRVGRRHGKRPDSGISRMICRSCKKSLSPGANSRIRIVSKQVVTTCLYCGRVRKFSPGE